MKRLILFIWLCPMVLIARAQWTAKDSLNLQRILNGQEDIKLNMDAVKQIDFNSLPGAPKMSKEKPGLKLDETLPQVLDRKKIVLTLRPYTANTKYNWDPIYQKRYRWMPIRGGEIRLSSFMRPFLPTGLKMYTIKVSAVHTRKSVPVGCGIICLANVPMAGW